MVRWAVAPTASQLVANSNGADQIACVRMRAIRVYDSSSLPLLSGVHFLKPRAGFWLAWAVLCAAAGCSPGDTGTVEGTVIVDGNPLGGFEVTFTSQADGSTALGYAKADGRYQLFRARGNRNIAVGEHKVTVTPTEMVDFVPKPNIRLPATYTDRYKTTLIRSVEPGANVIDFELDSVKK